MDDGTWQGYGVRIATNSFSLDQNNLLCGVLASKYGLVATPVINGYSKVGNNPQYNVYIHAESVSKLRDIVKTYFVDSMLYKLGL